MRQPPKGFKSDSQTLYGAEYSPIEIEFAKEVFTNPRKFARTSDNRTNSVTKSVHSILKSLQNVDSVLHWRGAALRWFVKEANQVKQWYSAGDFEVHDSEELAELKAELELCQAIARSDREDMTSRNHKTIRAIQEQVKKSNDVTEFLEDQNRRLSNSAYRVMQMHSVEVREGQDVCAHCAALENANIEPEEPWTYLQSAYPCATRRAIEGETQ